MRVLNSKSRLDARREHSGYSVRVQCPPGSKLFSITNNSLTLSLAVESVPRARHVMALSGGTLMVYLFACFRIRFYYFRSLFLHRTVVRSRRAIRQLRQSREARFEGNDVVLSAQMHAHRGSTTVNNSVFQLTFFFSDSRFFIRRFLYRFAVFSLLFSGFHYVCVYSLTSCDKDDADRSPTAPPSSSLIKDLVDLEIKRNPYNNITRIYIYMYTISKLKRSRRSSKLYTITFNWARFVPGGVIYGAKYDLLIIVVAANERRKKHGRGVYINCDAFRYFDLL